MSDLADIQWFSGESDGPKPAPRKCPLPRIGSKDWGWAPSNGAHESPLTRYWVVQSVYECRAEVWCENGEVAAVSGVRAFSHAKRIAELLARRDWRKEQGKR